MDDWKLNGIVESCRDSNGHVDFSDAEAMAHAVGDPTYDDVARLDAFVQDANDEAKWQSQRDTHPRTFSAGKASKEENHKLLIFCLLSFAALFLTILACITDESSPIFSLIIYVGAIAVLIAIFKLLFR